MVVNFDVVPLTNEEYKCIIFSTSFETPLMNISEINKELLDLDLKSCKVVFDMLTHMGNNSERFIDAYFNGKEIEMDTLNYTQVSKKHKLRKVACNYFKENLSILDKSILNSFQKKMLGKGIAI